MILEEYKIAIVHHWLVDMMGSERVCEALVEMTGFPDLFCLVAQVNKLSPALRKCSIHPSFIQNLPWGPKYYRYYAWLFPTAVEVFNLDKYDVVISSDAGPVKGVLTQPETCHICYCHSPMRYVWNLFHQYRDTPSRVRRLLIAAVMHYLRQWDYCASARVDYYLANSHNVKKRIRKYYRRDALVIYPPCDLSRFPMDDKPGSYYLCVGRLERYKRNDLAVQAFNTNGLPLVVAGYGSEAKKLRSVSKNNIEFVDNVSDEDIVELYAGCKALVFPGEEDFGIVPVEAQACGKPVIAYGMGGVLETVTPGKTGVFFPEQTAEALSEAVSFFERHQDDFTPEVIRRNAARFSVNRFKREMSEFIEHCVTEHRNRFVSESLKTE